MGPVGGLMASRTAWYDKYDSDGEDDAPPTKVSSISSRSKLTTEESPKGASARASRRSRSPNVHRGHTDAPRLPQEPTHTRIPEESTTEFLHSLRKTGSGQLEDIMTTLEVYKMKLEKMEKEKMMLGEEADLATKRAADLEVALAEERRRRKEEKAIRIEVSFASHLGIQLLTA